MVPCYCNSSAPCQWSPAANYRKAYILLCLHVCISCFSASGPFPYETDLSHRISGQGLYQHLRRIFLHRNYSVRFCRFHYSYLRKRFSEKLNHTSRDPALLRASSLYWGFFYCFLILESVGQKRVKSMWMGMVT